MNKKILIVDDEKEILDALKREIEWMKLPVTVETTFNPLYALDLVERESYDMLITDQRMPSIMGLEIIYRVKKSNPSTIKVLMSAYDDMDVLIMNFNEKNIDFYISKPWLRRDIHRIVNRLFEDKG